MEGLLFLVVIYWIFQTLIKAVKKAPEKTAQGPQGNAQYVRTAQSAKASRNGVNDAERARHAAHVQEELQKRRERQMEENRRQMRMGEVVGEGSSAYETMTHRLMDNAVNREYHGSLGVVSTEGEDTCDPSLGHDDDPEWLKQTVDTNEIGSEPLFDVRPRAMMQAIVMSEVLKRPAERRRGYR